MDFKKLAPWNWFTKEEESEGTVPIKRSEGLSQYASNINQNPIVHFYREMDRLFENVFRDIGLASYNI